ncbi:hypothetical protein [Fimbriiglobus ruber]|uniref:Uncharacterized protein n=1 Tax=Fimbriiglobus ruber TaxID=1908690 RepID=A0A225DJH7_9BACT|nr:hypothetical protein [Fimbriiglobus ruber]OWK41611.1 hypothetical protein FRUB_03689 [Fimbriiglobus ruber]
MAENHAPENFTNALFVLIAAGWWHVDKTYFPELAPKVPTRLETHRETVMAVTGAVVSPTEPASKLDGEFFIRAEEKAKGVPKPPEPDKATPRLDPELVAIGDESFATQALLTTQGGAVQQLTLNHFDEANRLVLEVKQADGKPQPLRPIPASSARGTRPASRKKSRSPRSFPEK